MKVKELIERLESFDPEAEVILSKDSEGNCYSPIDGFGVGYYVPITSWYGDFHSEEWSADDCLMDEDEWNEMREKPLSIVLWPTS